MSEPGYARVGGGDGLELGLEERPPRIHRRIGHRASGIEIVIEVQDVVRARDGGARSKRRCAM
jgi:hypothetical protein